jgi:hypothetical protein
MAELMPGTAFMVSANRREVALARLWFHIPSEDAERRATLYAINGFVFSLVFDPSAASVQRRTDAAIVRIELLSDSMD